MSRIIKAHAATLDGSAVTLGDGTARDRALRIPSGAYDTPIWVETAGGIVVKADRLPWQGVVPAGSVEVLSSDPDSGGNGGSLTHPNEPAGFVQITDNPFDVLEPEGWTNWESNFSIETDATAPLSPSNIGAALFPEGMQGGGGAVNVTTPIEATEFYLHFGFRVSANWVNHGGANAVKIFFIRNNGNGDLYFKIHGPPEGTLKLELNTQNVVGGNKNHGGNLGEDNEVVRDVWYDIEAIIKADSSPGATDGEIHVWMNGTKTHQWTTSLLRAGADRVFDIFQWNPTYGGGNEFDVPHDQWQYVDHVYLSAPA